MLVYQIRNNLRVLVHPTGIIPLHELDRLYNENSLPEEVAGLYENPSNSRVIMVLGPGGKKAYSTRGNWISLQHLDTLVEKLNIKPAAQRHLDPTLRIGTYLAAKDTPEAIRNFKGIGGKTKGKILEFSAPHIIGDFHRAYLTPEERAPYEAACTNYLKGR